MNLYELIEKNRSEEMRGVMRFINIASPEECARIISEIRVCHDNIIVWNEDKKCLDRVESICLNGEEIQLNLEKDDTAQNN